MNELNYPQDELELKTKIEEFNERWRNCIVSQIPEVETNDCFVPDGFYPYYTHQKIKILFIARESRGIGGCNYIELLHKAYKEKIVADRGIDQITNKFHALQLYISYAAQHDDIMNFYDFRLPYASGITESFATNNGPSFAFMELSKISNESKIDWKSDWNQIKSFIHYSSNEISKKYSPNFFAEELSLLKPNIIIGMNLDENYDLFGKTNYIKTFGDDNQVAAFSLETIMGETYYLLDSNHFSAPGKNLDHDYMSPIMEGIKYYKEHYFNL